MPLSFNGRLTRVEQRIQAEQTAWLKNLSDAELAAVAGDVDQHVHTFMDSLSDRELQELANGEPDAMRRFWLWQRRQAGS